MDDGQSDPIRSPLWHAHDCSLSQYRPRFSPASNETVFSLRLLDSRSHQAPSDALSLERRCSAMLREGSSAPSRAPSFVP